MLLKVISGGQTGVDQAALRAAQLCGIPTGGWAPKGFKTLDGPNILLQTEYGLKETESNQYPERTELNIIDSDRTLRFAEKWNSSGERLTSKLLWKHAKPHLDIHVSTRKKWFSSTIDEILAWIDPNVIGVLNIAGNSEKTAPGIGELVQAILEKVFIRLEYECI